MFVRSFGPLVLRIQNPMFLHELSQSSTPSLFFVASCNPRCGRANHAHHVCLFEPQVHGFPTIFDKFMGFPPEVASASKKLNEKGGSMGGGVVGESMNNKGPQHHMSSVPCSWFTRRTWILHKDSKRGHNRISMEGGSWGTHEKLSGLPPRFLKLHGLHFGVPHMYRMPIPLGGSNE